jgi:viroplasmin and RNaseH domain-containing protein
MVVAYVVFRGKVPGVYLSWPLCHMQVYRYKGNEYVGYNTYEEAVREWILYCENQGYDEEYIKGGIPRKQAQNIHHDSQGKAFNIHSSFSSNNEESSQHSHYEQEASRKYEAKRHVEQVNYETVDNFSCTRKFYLLSNCICG